MRRDVRRDVRRDARRDVRTEAATQRRHTQRHSDTAQQTHRLSARARTHADGHGRRPDGEGAHATHHGHQRGRVARRAPQPTPRRRDAVTPQPAPQPTPQSTQRRHTTEPHKHTGRAQDHGGNGVSGDRRHPRGDPPWHQAGRHHRAGVLRWRHPAPHGRRGRCVRTRAGMGAARMCVRTRRSARADVALDAAGGWGVGGIARRARRTLSGHGAVQL